MTSFAYKNFKKRYRGLTRSSIIVLVLGVIFISSIAIYFIENQPKTPNQSLAYINVAPSNIVPKITPDILTCNGCTKNIEFSFEVTSTLIKQTTISVESVLIFENNKLIKSYLPKDYEVSFNNTVQNKPIKIYKSIPSVLDVNVTTGSDSWNFGTYHIEMNVQFGSPFNANYTYSLTSETFTLINKFPSNVKYFIPIYIRNSQPNATVSPYQQMIKIDCAKYYSYEADDLSNIEFFDNNGSILSSWLENGNSNTGTSTYWVSIPNGLPANSTTVIFFGLADKSINLFDGKIIGEAPQLSPIYGQYDNIKNVMEPGLLYQVYYSKNATTFDSKDYQEQIYQATMSNGTKLNYDKGQFNTTLTPMNTTLNGSVSLGHQAIFAYQSGSPYSNLPNIDSNIIPNVQHPFAIKAVGWEDTNISTTFYTIVDDGVGISMGTTGPAFNGSSFLGGLTPPNNRIVAWHQGGATQYTFLSPRGTQRLEIDYYQWGGAWILYFGANNIVNYYHASLPPNNVVPTNILGTFSQV